jgi:hypothetical protein
MAEDDPIATPENVDSVDKLAKAYANLRREQQAAYEQLRRVRQEFGLDSEEAKKAQAEVDRLDDSMKHLMAGMSATEQVLIKARAALAGFGKDSGLATSESNVLSASVASLGDRLLGTVAAVAALGSNLTRALLNPLSSTKSIIDTLPAPLKNYNDIMRGHREILDLVNTSYAGFGREMTQSRTVGRDLVQEMGFLSARFGFSRDAVKGFVESSKSIPAIMDAIGKGTASAGTGATQLGDVLLALRGAGMDVAKSGSLMMDLYARFGAHTAPEVARQILIFAQAAKTTGVNIEFVQKHLVAASAPLAVFGQKADAAARTWTTFMDALKNTLPIEEIGKIVNTITGSIAKMSFQTRAFVSQMSGMAQGVSALGGALRMEMELRTAGGLERNLQQVTRMLARFGGGRITTLEEAVRNPAMEMQFQLQRQLVGQTLGVQGGQEQARVLEVLQRVQRGGISNLEAQRTMAKLTQSGRDVQRASLTALERMATTATQSHRTLEAIESIENSMRGHLEAMAGVLTRGRGREPLRPREARAAGMLLRRGIGAAASTAPDAMARFMRVLQRPGMEFVAGLTGRLPPGIAAGQPPRVRAADPVARLMAARREERVAPQAIEDIIALPRREEAPMPAFPFAPPVRRVEAPVGGLAPPPAPAAPLVAPGAGSAPAAGAVGPQASAATNITVGVICERCHEELVRKALSELSEQRDRHIQGVVTGRYAT